MKKLFGLLLVGGLALFLFSSAASASEIYCGGVGSGAGSTLFGTGGGTFSGNTVLSGGTATITCPGIVVPSGTSITSYSLQIIDDAQDPANGSSGVTWTWNGTLGNVVNTEAAGGGVTFGPCTSVPSGPLVCDVLNASVAGTFIGPGTSPTITYTVTAGFASGSGFDGTGVGVNGSDSAELYIDYNESGPAPEPATLTLVGGSLIGLGIIARKRRKKA
jgi:hypothetical protein